MKRILVPVDFSAVTKTVIKTASDLASPSARLWLLHSLPPPLITTDYGISMDAMQETIALAHENAARQLQHLGKQLTEKGFIVETKLSNGSPSAAIIDQAKRHKVDAIVLGAHGHGAFYNLIVGSTTQAVIKQAACPIVVVPAASVKSAKKAKRPAAPKRAKSS